MKKQLMALLISILMGGQSVHAMESSSDQLREYREAQHQRYLASSSSSSTVSSSSLIAENSGVALENSSFKDTPQEIIQGVFSHLPYSDLSKAARVCKEFNNNAHDPFLRNEVITKMSKEEVEKYLILAAKKGHEAVVGELLPYASEAGINEAFSRAAQNGHANVVVILCNDSRATRYDPLCLAASNGHANVVEILRNDSRVTRHGIYNALYRATNNGHAKVVEMLIKDSRVTEDGINNALRDAAHNGRANVVAILLKDSRVTVNGINNASRDAAHNGHATVVAILHNVCG